MFLRNKASLIFSRNVSFTQNNPETYDVIIADTSDPEGPAEQLFTKKFYEAMRSRLNKGGILCTQVRDEILYLYLPEGFRICNSGFHQNKNVYQNYIRH